jgi:hypothetical protein
MTHDEAKVTGSSSFFFFLCSCLENSRERRQEGYTTSDEWVTMLGDRRPSNDKQEKIFYTAKR